MRHQHDSFVYHMYRMVSIINSTHLALPSSWDIHYIKVAVYSFVIQIKPTIMFMLILSTAVVLSLANAQSPVNGVFALTWLHGFCQNQEKSKKEPCDPDQFDLWDAQSLTIHGMWVSPQKTKSNFGAYNRNLIFDDEELLSKMTNFFPPAIKYTSLMDDPEFLWRHEWSKHGSDFAAAVSALWPAYRSFRDYIERNKAVQLLFFRETIRFYEGLNARKLGRGVMSKRELGVALGIKEKEFNVVCMGRSQVIQVRVCFQVNKQAITVNNCPSLSSNCKDKLLVFDGWEQRNQDRVTAFPNIKNNDTN